MGSGVLMRAGGLSLAGPETVHNSGAGGVAGDVDSGAQHIKDTVHTEEDGQGIDGDAGATTRSVGPGTPAWPTAPRVLVTMMAMYWGRESSMPYICAMKVAAMA